MRIVVAGAGKPEDALIQEIFGNESGAYLNLITCAGDWIASPHQTTLRLVVNDSLDQYLNYLYIWWPSTP